MALTPLAVSHADVLRHIHGHPNATPAQIAEATGRIASNVKRDLPKLAEAGFIGLSPLVVMPEGEAVLAALDRADGRATSQDSPFTLLPLRQIFNDPLNPRKHFDDDAIAELAESIAVDGLLENLVVRRDPAGSEVIDTDDDGRERRVPIYRIVAGERRWRAMNLLASQDRWDHRAAIVPCKVLDIDDAAHRRIALVENLQRKDLRPIDEAQALKELMAVTGQGTAEVAEQIGFTQRFVQQRLQLLQLPDEVQTKVNAGDVSIEKARAIAAILPDLPPAKAKELTAGKITPDQARNWLDNQPKLRDDLTPRQWLILLEIADAAAQADGDPWSSIEVGAAIAEDPDWKAITDAPGYMVHGPNPIWEAGFDTGRLRVHLYSWGGGKQLALKFGADFEKAEPRQNHLAQARAAAGVEFPLGFEPGQYATPWLNGPFEVAADVQARIDKAKADRAAAQAAQAKAEREGAERQARAVETTQAILTEHRERERPILDPRFEEALAAFHIVLPVTVQPSGDVVDAKGRPLVRSGYYDKAPPPTLARNTLLALAINAAAGLHTPETAKAADPDALPRGEFIEVVAGCLLEDIAALDEAQAQAMAERGLAAYLAAEGIDYGHPDHDWEEGGAMAIAQGIREDGLGQAEAAPADPAEDEAA